MRSIESTAISAHVEIPSENGVVDIANNSPTTATMLAAR
jgi:hypothetical protein